MKKPLIGVAVALIAASGASAALAAVPELAQEGPATAGHNPTVKPSVLVYTGDGSGFFAGPRKLSRANFGHLHWSKWTNSKALGSGANWLDNCTPNCAQGKFTGYPVTLKLTRPRVVVGYDVFTRMQVTYTGKRPKGAQAQTTWKLSHNKTFFSWNYPSGAL